MSPDNGLDQGHHSFIAAMRSNDANALGRLLTEDAVFMPPHELPRVGRQACVEWFSGVVRQARTTGVDVTQREVIMGGDIAVERGSFVWKLLPPGGTEIEDRGNFVAIWQKQADGSWKVTRNIWNSAQPVAAAT